MVEDEKKQQPAQEKQAKDRREKISLKDAKPAPSSAKLPPRRRIEDWFPN